MNFFKAPKPSNVFDASAPPPTSTYTSSSNAYSTSTTNNYNTNTNTNTTSSTFPTDNPSFSNNPTSYGIDNGDNDIEFNVNKPTTFPTDNKPTTFPTDNPNKPTTFPTDNQTFANNVQSSQDTSGGCCNPRRAGVWTIVTLIVGTILFIVGGSLLPVGISAQSAANELDAKSDFYVLENTCQILDAIFIKTKQETGDKGRKTGCKDYYEYDFDAYNLTLEDPDYYDGLTEYTFRSRDQISPRECNDCNRCERAGPKYEEGDYVRCWRPETPGGMFVPNQYRCGNEECIKIFDPQDDVDLAKGIAMAIWIAGIVVIALAIPSCIFGVIFYGVQKGRGGFGRR